MLSYLTHLPFVYLPVAPVFLSPFSNTPVLHRLHAPLFPLDPLENEKDITTQISPQRLSHSPPAYLDILLISFPSAATQ